MLRRAGRWFLLCAIQRDDALNHRCFPMYQKVCEERPELVHSDCVHVALRTTDLWFHSALACRLPILNIILPSTLCSSRTTQWYLLACLQTSNERLGYTATDILGLAVGETSILPSTCWNSSTGCSHFHFLNCHAWPVANTAITRSHS